MIPDSINSDTWADFLLYRQEIRKPLTEIGQKRMLARLLRLHQEGYDPNATLDLAMSEGWRGVWASEECKRKIRPASHGEGPKIESVDINRDAGLAQLRLVRGALK